jgi:hypothetical protein
MNLHTFSIAAIVLLAVAASSQAQQPTTPPAGPATSPTEGTAADRTRPGQTPTQTAPRQAEDPRPATSETEGTAADRTSPGSATTGGGDAAKRGAQRSELVGAAVVSSADAPLGEVVDVVFDARNQPSFVVIESQGKAVAVPYAAANSMKKADKIVIEQSRLQGAPKLEEGAWRDPASKRWQQESTRYWERG